MRIYSFFRPVGSYKYCWCKYMKWKWIMSSLLSSFEHCTTCRNIITSSSYTIILHNFRAALKLKISAISPLNRHYSHVLLQRIYNLLHYTFEVATSNVPSFYINSYSSEISLKWKAEKYATFTNSIFVRNKLALLQGEAQLCLLIEKNSI